jgi:hypothetical protein
VPPIFFGHFLFFSAKKIGSPVSRSRGAHAALILMARNGRLAPFSTEERFNLKEDHSMTTSYRILKTSGGLRIECGGEIYAEDQLYEAIWLYNQEVSAGLPRREANQAKQKIAQLEELLAVLRRAGA